MKEQKGITLVALIITIIVMLILVAVTVGIIVESDLITATHDAADEYNKVDDNLKNVSDKAGLIKDGKGDGSIQYYVNQAKDANKGTVADDET